VRLDHSSARLLRPVRLTLDGIAKGYAVDLAVQCLRQHGVRQGWVNAGGDLRAFGEFTLPVHRRESDGSLRSLGGLRQAALASSWVQPAQGHDPDFPALLVGPADQQPRPGVFSVVARTAWRADALTKVAAACPPPHRAALLQRLGGALIAPAAAANPLVEMSAA
jgi:FAD:protein FMN transferase